jgi:hypothetical protein
VINLGENQLEGKNFTQDFSLSAGAYMLSEREIRFVSLSNFGLMNVNVFFVQERSRRSWESFICYSTLGRALVQIISPLKSF